MCNNKEKNFLIFSSTNAMSMGIFNSNRPSCETHSRGQIRNWQLQVDKPVPERTPDLLYLTLRRVFRPRQFLIYWKYVSNTYPDDTHCKIVLKVAILRKKSLIERDIG